MNFKKNEIEIIKLLLTSSDYLTSYDISEKTGISQRSVRTEMKKVKEILRSFDCHFISKTSKGYYLDQKESQEVMDLMQSIRSFEQSRDTVIPSIDWEKNNYVMKRLIETDDYIKVETLYDELFVSQSSLSKILKDIKIYFDKYHFSLIQKPNYGIKLQARELDKRKALCDFLTSNINQSNMVMDFLYSFLKDKQSTEYKIIQLINDSHILFSDIGLFDFLMSLSVNITRIGSGHLLTETPNLSNISDRKEFEIAKKIGELLNNENSITLNTHELNDIAIKMICKSEIKNECDIPICYSISHEILQKIYEETAINLSNETFLTHLPSVIELIILQIQFDEKIRTPYFDDVKNNQPLAYYMAVLAGEIIQSHFHQTVSRSILAYLSFEFNNELVQLNTSRKNVLLLCGQGQIDYHHAKTVLNQYFSEIMSIKKAIPVYQFSNENINQYDLIISTMALHQKTSIPHINISSFLTSSDIETIDNYFSLYFNRIPLEKVFHPKLFENHSTITRKELFNNHYDYLSSLFTNINTSAKNIVCRENNYEAYIDNHTLLLTLTKPVTNIPVVSLYLLEKEMEWDENIIDTIILSSGEDSKHHIIRTLKNIIKTFPLDTLTLSSYDYFHFIQYITQKSA